MLRARGSPSFRSHLPSRRGGWRADKAQCPDCSRRMSGSGRTMVHSGAPAPCGAPTGIFGLRLVNGRTSQELFVPGGFSPSVARGSVCVIADPQVPSRSRLANASGRRPANFDRDRVDIAELHAKHKNFLSLLVNDVCVMRADLTYVRV